MYNIDSFHYRRENAPLHNKSYEFAVRIVNHSKKPMKHYIGCISLMIVSFLNIHGLKALQPIVTNL